MSSCLAQLQQRQFCDLLLVRLISLFLYFLAWASLLRQQVRRSSVRGPRAAGTCALTEADVLWGSLPAPRDLMRVPCSPSGNTYLISD